MMQRQLSKEFAVLPGRYPDPRNTRLKAGTRDRPARVGFSVVSDPTTWAANLSYPLMAINHEDALGVLLIHG